MPKQKPRGVKATQGQKMIEVKVRFWTDSIAAEKDTIVPKHAWTKGVVRMESNASHGIHPENPRPFNSLMDITAVIEKVLIEHGVVLHPSSRLKKLVTTEDT